MSTTGTIPGVRIVDMPDLGAFTPDSSVVGEHAGSGRFSATALASYLGSQAGFRNKLMNATFARATRGTSFTATVNGQYMLDGFKVGSDGTFSVNVNRLAFTPGQTSVPYGPRYFMRFQPLALSGANYLLLGMPVPDVVLLAGQPTVLSVWMLWSGTSSLTVTASASQNFGGGGSPPVEVYSTVTTPPITNTWQRYSFPIQMPSISGKVLNSAGLHWTEIQLLMAVAAGTAYTLDIAQPQWEAGSVASAFEVRPDAIDEEMCGRFLRRTGMGMAGGTANATVVQLGSSWPRMWAVPTISLIPGMSASIVTPGDNNFTTASPTFAATSVSTNGCSVQIGGFTGLTALHPAVGTGDFLYVSAEV